MHTQKSRHMMSSPSLTELFSAYPHLSEPEAPDRLLVQDLSQAIRFAVHSANSALGAKVRLYIYLAAALRQLHLILDKQPDPSRYRAHAKDWVLCGQRISPFSLYANLNTQTSGPPPGHRERRRNRLTFQRTHRDIYRRRETEDRTR